MSRLIFMVIGFCVGVSMARNAEPMPDPVVLAVFLVMGVGVLAAWFAGFRGKNEAVAVAVATATAKARAEARSEANAVAQQAVVISLAGLIPETMPANVSPDAWSLVESVREKIDSRDGNVTEALETTVAHERSRPTFGEVMHNYRAHLAEQAVAKAARKAERRNADS